MKTRRSRQLTASEAASVLLYASCVCGQNTGSLIAVPPSSTRCVSYCDSFEDVALGAGGSGVVRLYRDAGRSWGFLNVTMPDTRNVPVDEPLEAHLHQLKCDEPGASSTNGASINGIKFTWNLDGEESTNRFDTATFEELLVPPPDQAGSVVVHQPNYEQHLCCSLQSCEPPAAYECAAACTESEWVILDSDSVERVGGAAALWTGEAGGTFSVVDITLRGESAQVAALTITATLHDGGANVPGPVWVDPAQAGASQADAGTVSVVLPPPVKADGPRLRTVSTTATAPTVTAEGQLALVLTANDAPIASCALSACTFPPGGNIGEDIEATYGPAGAEGDSGSGGGAPLGAVIGGVVGGVAVIGIIVLAAALLIKRRKQAGDVWVGEPNHLGMYQAGPPGYGPGAWSSGTAPPYPGPYPPSHDPKYASGYAVAVQQPLSVHSADTYPKPYSENMRAASASGSAPPTQATLSWLDTGTASSMNPTEGLSKREQLEEALDEMRVQGRLFAGRYTVLGSFERRGGGQGVVQFVRDVDTAAGHAVKFFFDRQAFEREQALYNNPTLRSMMAATRNVSANDGPGALVSPSGYRFPRHIVIERGEPLDEWIKRMIQRTNTGLIETIDVFKALVNIAEKLAALREAGYVHRDIKPSNVLWLQGMHAWTLIDFGSTVAAGSKERLSFTLTYAAPEVIAAYQSSERSLVVDPANDVWSLGVIAFEMLTGEPVFKQFTETQQVIDALLGQNGQYLPWEGPRRAELLKKLRVFKVNVLECLDRDPRKRPPIASVVKGWEALFRSATATEAPP